MKVLSFLTIVIFLLSSCEKEDLAPKLRSETAEKMMGKWMVQRTSLETVVKGEYYPPLLRNSKIEVLGAADEYFDFQANELVEIKTSKSAARHKNYKVWNPSQVMVGQEGWWIEKLTATEMVLKLERIYAGQNRRYATSHVTQKLLSRP